MKARRFDFYFDDWLVGTVMLTPAERGIYITAVAAIGSHGGPLLKTELRRLCPMHGNSFNSCIKNLISLGKLVEKGAYFTNKRAASEVKKAAKRVRSAVENGRKGGRPHNKNNELVKPDGLQNAKPERKLPSPSPSPSPSVGKKEERCSLREQRARGDPPGFDEWWEAYPHKVGKSQARKAWEAALAKTSLGEMIIGVQRYIATKPPDRQWCNPVTWLTGERWLDEPGSAPINGANGHDKPSAVDKLRIGAALAVQAVLERDREREQSAEDQRARHPTNDPLLDGE